METGPDITTPLIHPIQDYSSNAVKVADIDEKREAENRIPSRHRRVLIYTIGSRGDVQPFCALACGLRDRGMDVAVATEKRLQSLVEQFGIEFYCIAGDSTGVLFEPAAQQVLLDGSFFKLMSLTQEWDAKFDKNEILASYVSAANNFSPDVIVGSALSLTQSYCVAEYKRIPWLSMILAPTVPTREFPLYALKGIACCSCLNRWSYSVAFKALWGQESEFIQPWRQRLGLAPLEVTNGLLDIITERDLPVLIACSTLLCGPKRAVPADYSPAMKVSGFVFAPPSTEAEINPEVRAFVEDVSSGKPLIYLGFGSMPSPDPIRLIRLAVDVCRLANCRAIVIAGWSNLSDPACQTLIAEQRASGSLLVVPSVPHDWLFPKVGCIVHHCGVGTLAAALRSGVPQVPCPFMLDQPHNAELLVDLGVAPCVVPYNASITAEQVADAVRITLSQDAEGRSIRQEAIEMGQFVREESASTLDVFAKVIQQCTSSY